MFCSQNKYLRLTTMLSDHSLGRTWGPLARQIKVICVVWGVRNVDSCTDDLEQVHRETTSD